MKLYAVVALLALAAAATLGYVNGKGASQMALVDACTERKFAVLFDAGTQAHRHFHCFELQPRADAEPPKRETVRQLLHL
jgi:hypothetical protein